jgi:hypothetical protein
VCWQGGIAAIKGKTMSTDDFYEEQVLHNIDKRWPLCH